MPKRIHTKTAAGILADCDYFLEEDKKAALPLLETIAPTIHLLQGRGYDCEFLFSAPTDFMGSPATFYAIVTAADGKRLVIKSYSDHVELGDSKDAITAEQLFETIQENFPPKLQSRVRAQPSAEQPGFGKS